MARKRHTPEQILGKLRDADVLLTQGESIAEVARKLEVSEQTYHRWRNQFGGMKGEEMKRLKELEEENRRLKKMYAEERLKAEIRQEALEGMPMKRGRLSYNAISAPRDGGCSKAALRRQCSVCLSLFGYQRGDLLLPAQTVC